MPSITWHLTDYCTEQGKHWDVYNQNDIKDLKILNISGKPKTMNNNIMDNAFWLKKITHNLYFDFI